MDPILVGQISLQTHPTALPDPVAQPPVIEGDAACCGQEQEHVDDED